MRFFRCESIKPSQEIPINPRVIEFTAMEKKIEERNNVADTRSTYASHLGRRAVSSEITFRAT